MTRKDQIIEAVISIFREDGFSTDLKMTKIASICNIGKSTIYEYFKSKDDLIKSALLKMSDNGLNRIFNIENIDTMSFEDSFKAQVIVMYEIACESRMMFEVFSNDFKNQLPESIQKELVVKMSDFKELIEKRFIMIMLKGVQEGLISMSNDILKANVVSGLIIGSMIRYSDADLDLDLVLFVDKVYDAVLKISN